MFAGPNGSEKSVLKSSLPEVLLGVYLNADEIEAEVKKCGFVDLRKFDVETTEEEVQGAGYRTDLYYVATDEPAINVSRVENRVKLNGHDVPPDLVTKRYYRSLDLLMSAIRFTHRAYIFDNSTDNADRNHRRADARIKDQHGPGMVQALCAG
jgi:predicted ABC-type ATPase